MALRKLEISGKWATGGNWSGGVAPTENDDVEIPESKEVKVEAAAKCRSLVVRKKAKVTGSSALTIGGAAKPEVEFNAKQGWALIVEAEAVISYTGTITLASAVTTEALLISVDKTIALKSTVNFSVGKLKQKYKLEEAFATTGSWVGAETMSWNTNGKKFEVKTFEATSGKQIVIELGASEVVITGGGEFSGWEAPAGTEAVLSASEATIVMKGAGGTFLGAGLTYGTLKVEAAKVAVKGSNTVGTLTLNTAGLEATKFAENNTQTVTTFTHNGKEGSLVKLESTVAAKNWKLHKASGNVNTDFLELKDSHVDASPSWYAGTGSTNVSGNENWKFEAEAGKKTQEEAVTIRGGTSTLTAAVKVATASLEARAGVRASIAAQRLVPSIVALGTGSQITPAAVRVATSPFIVQAGARSATVAMRVAVQPVSVRAGAQSALAGARVVQGALTNRAGSRTAIVAVKVAQGTVVVSAGASGVLTARVVYVAQLQMRSGTVLTSSTNATFIGTARFATGARVMFITSTPGKDIFLLAGGGAQAVSVAGGYAQAETASGGGSMAVLHTGGGAE